MASPEERAREMEALYREYRSPMLGIARSILRDDGLAEDAVQQAFLKIFQNFSKIPRGDCNKTRSFFVIIIRNTAIDLYRKRGRERVISFEDLEAPLPAFEAQPEEQLIAAQGAEALTAFLSRLEERYANLLMLRYYHGYHNKEIAEFLGMTQTQVAVGIYRGKQKLQKIMAEGGDFDGT